jgi:hypothetical protein
MLVDHRDVRSGQVSAELALGTGVIAGVQACLYGQDIWPSIALTRIARYPRTVRSPEEIIVVFVREVFPVVRE